MGHGGKRIGAGRTPGLRNVATAGVKDALEKLARKHSGVALETLAQIAADGESEAARVAAATALLDRGYGRPRQVQDTNLTMDAGSAFVAMLRWVNDRRGNGALANGVAELPEQPAAVRH